MKNRNNSKNNNKQSYVNKFSFALSLSLSPSLSIHFFILYYIIEPLSASSGRQLLVGYWGQNGAGPAHGPANYEKPLIEVCKTTKYDILAVSFVVVFFDSRNKGIYII